MEHFDIGNHHFPALARTALAEELVKTCAPNMRRVIYGSGGGEAIDIAIKTARHTRQRRKIVSIAKGYHGHTGLAVAAGDQRFSELFLADQPDEFVQVPFNDLAAMEDALRGRDVAAVLMETIPATYGFPLPEPGYLAAVKRLCETLRRAVHRRRGADGPDAHRRDVGHPEGRDRARHHGRRQGHHGRHVPDRVRRRERGVLGLAEGGRLRPHLDRRRRRARLHRRPEGARDLQPPRGALDGALHLGPLRTRAARDPGAVPRLVHRDPSGRRRDGARVRPPAGRQARHARALPARRVGDLLDARPAHPAVQARHPVRGPSSSTRCSTAPRCRSGAPSPRRARPCVRRRSDDRAPARRAGRRPACADDAAARPLGRERVRELPGRCRQSHHRGGRRGCIPERGTVCGMGGP